MSAIVEEARVRALVTGGAGYIGSHVTVELIGAGHDVAVMDNLANSNREVFNRLRSLTGIDVPFLEVDIRDGAAVAEAVLDGGFDALVHCAGLKSVAESVADPIAYYNTNVAGAIGLFRAMGRAGVKKMVFSSSATVYGRAATVPVSEEAPVGPVNPYGNSKLVVEMLLRDIYRADPGWDISLLRYFNPVGAHPSGLIGEDPADQPNNLMPILLQVAIGRRDRLTVHGNDYPTRDGTGVRDYIHVVDLAKAHVAALETQEPAVEVYNLGTGSGTTVLELIEAFEQVSKVTVPIEVGPRRPGDVAELWCDPSKAERELGWKAERSLAEMCEDSWRWQTMNPDGYPG